MNTSLNQIELHLRADGTIDLQQPGSDQTQAFDTLVDALRFAHSLDPHGDSRVSVFDVDGRKIVETFA